MDSNKSAQTEVVIEWDDIKFDVELKKEKETKRILKGVSGHLLPGEVAFVLGPSGSGKTTFLNILARRVVETGGEIRVNGKPVPDSFPRHCGYVQQHDVYFESLTVKETLSYAARLRLGPEYTRAQKEARVEEVLEELDLVHVAGSRIGKSGAGGISGGERRRLSVAMELLYSPSVLLLDEPTSGLDSASAMRLVGLLRRLASRRRCTIVCTLHQPRASVLPSADRVLLLADGRVVYFGPTWSEESDEGGMLDFFRTIGLRCPAHENPADFALDLLNTADTDKLQEMLGSMPAPKGESAAVTAAAAEEEGADGKAVEQEEGEERGEDGSAAGPAGEAAGKTAGDGGAEAAAVVVDMDGWSRDDVVAYMAEQYNDSPWAAASQKVGREFPTALGDRSGGRKYANGWLTQFVVVLERSFVYKLREPIAVATQFVNAVVVPFMIGTIYWQIGTSQASIQLRIASTAWVSIMIAFLALDVILIWPIERSVYLRDQAAGMYTTSAFYLGRSLAEMPFHVLFSCFAGIIASVTIGFQASALPMFILLTVFLAVAGVSVLMAAGAVCRTMEQANGVVTLVLVVFSIVSPGFTTRATLPAFYRFMYDISFVRLGIEGMLINEFRGLEFTCTPTEAAFGCTPTGQSVLERLQIQDGRLGDYLIWLAVQAVVYRVIAYLGLRFLHTGQSFRQRLRM